MSFSKYLSFHDNLSASISLGNRSMGSTVIDIVNAWCKENGMSVRDKEFMQKVPGRHYSQPRIARQ